jgi:hypothetical protein
MHSDSASQATWIADRGRLWWAKLIEVLTVCMSIVVFFYAYTGVLGIHSIVVVDILTFVAAVTGGQWLSYRIIISPRGALVPAAVSVMALLLLVLLFAVLTFTPPHIPLFQEATSGTYGPT